MRLAAGTAALILLVALAIVLVPVAGLVVVPGAVVLLLAFTVMAPAGNRLYRLAGALVILAGCAFFFGTLFLTTYGPGINNQTVALAAALIVLALFVAIAGTREKRSTGA